MMMNEFEIFDHTADIGIRLRRNTREELFRDAALAMFSIMAPESEFEARIDQKVYVAGDDDEQLMVNWLSELNFLFQTRQFVPVDILVEMTANALEATLTGDTVDPQKHAIVTEIKAVTYHRLEVVTEENGWRAQILFDI
jgi:SHS2 domain-containing protein